MHTQGGAIRSLHKTEYVYRLRTPGRLLLVGVYFSLYRTSLRISTLNRLYFRRNCSGRAPRSRGVFSGWIDYGCLTDGLFVRNLFIYIKCQFGYPTLIFTRGQISDQSRRDRLHTTDIRIIMTEFAFRKFTIVFYIQRNKAFKVQA